MDTRYDVNPRDYSRYTNEELRKNFLIDELFTGRIKMVYTHIDRMIAGGVCPVKPAELRGSDNIKADYFLERREMGIINIGKEGMITADGKEIILDNKDCVYLGKGTKNIVFSSKDPAEPAKFYFLSAPAHKEYPVTKVVQKDVLKISVGSKEKADVRTIYKYIHPDGVKSCNLVMGITELNEGSIWNTMPCHTHERRMEIYMYFDIPEDDIIVHFMGKGNEIRDIIMRNEQAVISPSWSVHSGVGTRRYSFIWGMAGENQAFADMDMIPMSNLK